MENQSQENTGYNFEPSEQFSWNRHQMENERFAKIQQCIIDLRDLCCRNSNQDDPEDRMLLDTMGRVLETLEHTFTHHFENKSGHIVSPKSSEPWD